MKRLLFLLFALMIIVGTAYCAELENEKQREAAAHDLFDD